MIPLDMLVCDDPLIAHDLNQPSLEMTSCPAMRHPPSQNDPAHKASAICRRMQHIRAGVHAQSQEDTTRDANAAD
jgi:hypothetical protein